MILDFEKDSLPEASPFVIIGGGAVGLVLAISLARKGKQVVVLETGGRAFDPAMQDLNKPVIEGRRHLGITEGRARLLGGTTTLWGGQLVAFDAIDMEPRPWLGLDAWPIQLSDLHAFYSEVAKLLGLDSTNADDQEVWRELDLSPPELNNNFSVILTRWLREPNLARYFQKELVESPNIHVALHAHCVSFDFDEDNRISAATVVSPSNRSTKITANKFIIANGTIEASRLMLATARTGAPWSHNAWLGKGFQDHLDIRAARIEILDEKKFHNSFENIVKRGFKYQPKIISSSSFQRNNLTTNLAASIVADSAVGEHIAKLKVAIRSIIRGAKPESISDIFKSISGTARVWLPLILRYLRDNRIMQVADRGLFLMLHCEQIPLENSSIRLSADEHDAYGMPLVTLDWQVSGQELRTMRLFTEELGAALEQGGLARLEIDPRLSNEEESFLEGCRDTNHHCGGLRMSKTVADGVTDVNLKVHNCDNLYIAGAATFPSSSFANPTFTAMALAVRLAEHLAE